MPLLLSSGCGNPKVVLRNARSGAAPKAGLYTSARGLHANAYHTGALSKFGGTEELLAIWNGRKKPSAKPFSRKSGDACRKTSASGWPPDIRSRVYCSPALTYTSVTPMPVSAWNRGTTNVSSRFCRAGVVYTMRFPCWTLYRSASDTARPTDNATATIENALLRIAVPHLDPFRFRPLLHHDVDFLSPAHVRDVHRDLCAAVERDVRRSVRTHLDGG